MRICPKCGKVVSYNSYFSAYICTGCNWEDSTIDQKQNMGIVYDIKSCIDHDTCSKGCRIHIVRTEGGSYKVGCVTHSVWQQRGYTTIKEAIDAWNKSQGGTE